MPNRNWRREKMRSEWVSKKTHSDPIYSDPPLFGELETTGEARLDDDKIGRLGFWTPPTDENPAIWKAEAENLSNDGAIWVTSPWKPSKARTR